MLINYEDYLLSNYSNDEVSEVNSGKMITEQSGWRSNAQVYNEMLASGRALEQFRAEHYHTGYFTELGVIDGPMPKSLYFDREPVDQAQAFLDWERKREKMVSDFKSARSADFEEASKVKAEREAASKKPSEGSLEPSAGSNPVKA
jgi:hypothetical protein